MSDAREFSLAWILGGLVVALAITVGVLVGRLRAARAQIASADRAVDARPPESEAVAALRVSDARMQESEARFRQLAESIASVFYLMSRKRRETYFQAGGAPARVGMMRRARSRTRCTPTIAITSSPTTTGCSSSRSTSSIAWSWAMAG